MNSSSGSFTRWAVPLLSAWAAAHAAPLEIGRSPILTATLPAGSTWQVEMNAGSAWTPTGVLVAGAPAAATVRLDGSPVSASYRLARLGTVDVITPVVSGGFYLAGTATAGATQVEFQTAADLTSWTYAASTTPDAAGNFLRVVRPPLTARAFFRARSSADAGRSVATITSYPADPANNAAGYGAIGSDMPQIYKDGLVGSLPAAEFNRDGYGAAAGECYELTGMKDRATVMIVDYAPSATTTATRGFFDLGSTAFQKVTGQVDGISSVGYRLVPAPVTGNVKLFVAASSGPYYLEVRPYNHRAGVAKVEVQNSGATDWFTLSRTTGNNSFAFTAGSSTLSFPIRFRVTSRFGEVVNFDPVSSAPNGGKFTGSAQFQIFPELAPAPAFALGPVFVDSLATTPGDSWVASTFGGTTVTQPYTIAYQGAASLQISGLGGFNGVDFSHNGSFPQPEFGSLQFAIRSATGSTVHDLGIVFSGTGPVGGTATSATVALPEIDATWRVLRIPLKAAGAPANISDFQVISTSSSSQPAVLLDSISILQP